MAAAASFEVGALFTVVYVGLLAATRSIGSRRQGVLLLAPALLSVFLLYLQFSGRVSQASEVIGAPKIAHHALASMLATAKTLPFELLKGDALRHKYTGLAEGILIKALFFVGLYFAMSAQPGSSSKRIHRMRLVLTAALRRHSRTDDDGGVLQFWRALLRKARHASTGLRADSTGVNGPAAGRAPA